MVGGGDIGNHWKSAPESTPAPSPVVKDLQPLIDFIQETLSQSNKAINLATLAAQVKARFGAVTTNWYGHDSFKGLLFALKINALRVSPEPPGYVYLDGTHPPLSKKASIAHADVFQGTPNTQVPQETEGLDAQLQTAIGFIRIHTDAPIIPKLGFKRLFEAMSEEVQANEFNLADTSKAIRDRCLAGGYPIGRKSINWVLKGIHLSGHKYDSDVPQEPSVLADAFVRSLLANLKKNHVELTDDDTHRIRDYFSGGLLKTTPENPTSNLTDVPLGT
jgi:hypothetical protein